MLLRLSSIYFTYMVEILYNRVLLRISSQLHIQLYHIGSLKLVMTGVFTLPYKQNLFCQPFFSVMFKTYLQCCSRIFARFPIVDILRILKTSRLFKMLLHMLFYIIVNVLFNKYKQLHPEIYLMRNSPLFHLVHIHGQAYLGYIILHLA